jgi:hypothetical protein
VKFSNTHLRKGRALCVYISINLKLCYLYINCNYYTLYMIYESYTLSLNISDISRTTLKTSISASYWEYYRFELRLGGRLCSLTVLRGFSHTSHAKVVYLSQIGSDLFNIFPDSSSIVKLHLTQFNLRIIKIFFGLLSSC